jgi:hypothetical protein
MIFPSNSQLFNNFVSCQNHNVDNSPNPSMEKQLVNVVAQDILQTDSSLDAIILPNQKININFNDIIDFGGLDEEIDVDFESAEVTCVPHSTKKGISNSHGRDLRHSSEHIFEVDLKSISQAFESALHQRKKQKESHSEYSKHDKKKFKCLKRKFHHLHNPCHG